VTIWCWISAKPWRSLSRLLRFSANHLSPFTFHLASLTFAPLADEAKRGPRGEVCFACPHWSLCMATMPMPTPASTAAAVFNRIFMPLAIMGNLVHCAIHSLAGSMRLQAKLVLLRNPASPTRSSNASKFAHSACLLLRRIRMMRPGLDDPPANGKKSSRLHGLGQSRFHKHS
jgi:hypothetical protein